MRIRQFARIAIVATVSIIPSGLYAQSEHATTIDAGPNITSITRLSPRRGATNFDSYDASVNGTVSLQVSAFAGDVGTGIEAPSKSGGSRLPTAGTVSRFGGGRSQSAGALLQQGGTSASFGLNGTISSLSSGASKSQKTALQRLGGERVALSSPGSSAPSGQTSPSHPGQSMTTPSNHSFSAGMLSQTSALPGMHSESPSAGVRRGKRGSETKGGRLTESGSSLLSGNRAQLDADAPVNDSDRTSGDEQGTRGLFEAVKDPFAIVLARNFENPRGNVSLERVCGDACTLGAGGVLDDSKESDAERSETTAERANPMNRPQLQNRLESAEERLSGTSLSLHAQGPEKPNGADKLQRRSVNPAEQKISPK